MPFFRSTELYPEFEVNRSRILDYVDALRKQVDGLIDKQKVVDVIATIDPSSINCEVSPRFLCTIPMPYPSQVIHCRDGICERRSGPITRQAAVHRQERERFQGQILEEAGRGAALLVQRLNSRAEAQEEQQKQ